jgi:hypothetical protein
VEGDNYGLLVSWKIREDSQQHISWLSILIFFCQNLTKKNSNFWGYLCLDIALCKSELVGVLQLAPEGAISTDKDIWWSKCVWPLLTVSVSEWRCCIWPLRDESTMTKMISTISQSPPKIKIWNLTQTRQTGQSSH